MCSNYAPTRAELIAHYGVSPPPADWSLEAYPGSMAPIIRAKNQDSAERECVRALFGMVPHWGDVKLARKTYNSRSETTATKPSFRNAWKRSQFCIIPAEIVFEPCYDTGKPVRWGVSDADGAPLSIAGIWETKIEGADNIDLISFSMLTVNADGHPMYEHFHKPGDEKRMVVLLAPDQHEAWLHATPGDAMDFMKCYPADRLKAAAMPRPTKPKVPLVKARPKQGAMPGFD